MFKIFEFEKVDRPIKNEFLRALYKFLISCFYTYCGICWFYALAPLSYYFDLSNHIGIYLFCLFVLSFTGLPGLFWKIIINRPSNDWFYQHQLLYRIWILYKMKELIIGIVVPILIIYARK